MADTNMKPRVVIVGAGPAGVRAAETIVRAGLRPIVIDEAERGGGQIYRRQPINFTRGYETLYGSEGGKAQRLHEDFDRLAPEIVYKPNSQAWALLDGKLHVVSGNVTTAIEYDRLLLATGATDRIMPISGWTLPGVYSLGASQIALKAQGCSIGKDVIFVGTGPLLYLVAYQYLKAGNPPAAVLDTSSLWDNLAGLPLMASKPSQVLKGFSYIRSLRRAGVTVQGGINPLAVLGDAETGVAGLRLEYKGTPVELGCNAIGMGYHLRSESQLADLAGCLFSFDPVWRQWFPDIDDLGRSSVENVYLAGDGVRLLGADGAEVSGRLAALALLSDAGIKVSSNEMRQLRNERRRHLRFAMGIQKAFPWPVGQIAGLPDDTLVCRCEAITAGELRRSASALGAPEVNRAKAFSRVGMGRCQGRFCGQASQEIVAAARKATLESVGRLRGQAPVKPLPIIVRCAEDDHA
ncbi:NAD(P)/FAD-dependent oxidoreductase [Rhizobium leguminosarum]|uniref:FAD/NAD(P)-dependent oxidoreductase n=1 Tax=Rhizobium leguminosarum TaxID=384 RepID=UPI001C91425C|nr:FAD/NAD(P)-binding oxidoreductase [Rhizobium leguminosarum]MBY2915368.1 NAD(P)/FAD-dependent oxidoreductase [Rhizobium leguminosarum]MBY2970906.1 NAD(P)/FAD-dependent oxidoreductase [Rhizobium leguminosarum]MBY2977973.1 NAD(P)/FAD-dependent oxidoreductase [Rhizobium leguminosarum]MBY3006523.1 NAD(P)/FAD-dependent oxidoreductase [Rhizobium leguminosarum]